MSHILFNFLNDSPLFMDSYIRDDFSKFTHAELLGELQKYREYVLEHIEPLNQEIHDSCSRLSVSIQGFDMTSPQSDLLKQLSLYMDTVVVSDPIFEFTSKPRDTAQQINTYLGFSSEEIDRESLSKACRYVKSLTRLVTADYVKLFPINLLHEPPEQLPIYYSENYFSDILPQELLNHFYTNSKVYPMETKDGNWVIADKELEPCRGIAVEYQGHPGHAGKVYFLFESKVVSMDEETHEILFQQYLPETPPEKEYFDAWVFQSVNRSAGGFINQVLSEIYQSSAFGSMYLTTSPFVADLLGYKLNVPDNFNTEIANMILKLDLPLLHDVSLENLVDIRTQDGEAFNNFRIALEKNLRGLRGLEDSDKLRRELENVAHEMSEVQINEIQNKVHTIRKTSGIDMAIATASLSTAIQTHALSLLGLGVIMAKGYKNYVTYQKEVKQNPSYFLWKSKSH